MDFQLQIYYMNKVLVIGESCNDVFIYGDTPRLSPEGPAPVFIENYRITNGGMGKNVVNNLEALRVGTDFYHQNTPITKTRYIHQASNGLLLRVDAEANIDRINYNLLRDINYWDYQMVVISDYNKGFLLDEDIAYIAYKHPNVICDTKKPLGDWCKDLKFIKLNRNEFNNNRDFINGNHWLMDKLLITLDKDGCKYGNITYPTKKVDIRDISGAGDTFVAGFTKSMLETNDIPKSINYGNLCSSQVVQSRGVTIINYENL